MGRKSSAKEQRPPAGDPVSEKKGPSRLWLGALIVVLVGGGAYVALSRGPANDAAAADAAAAGQPTDQMAKSVAFAQEMAALGPRQQASYPPIPYQQFAPPRPAPTVNAAFQFAAEHPEVLSYIPCFCGCEHGGHRGNEDCFVAARNDKGDVTDWEPHGAT